MNIRLDNKVAVVTGAASGIGLACCKYLAESGAKVALADINRDRLAEATQAVQRMGTAKGYWLDVTDVQVHTYRTSTPWAPRRSP